MAGPVDQEIGRRIRVRRLEIGISQETLATKLGISFQQVQKYELGRNRIAATMLMDIAEALDIAVTALLPVEPAAAADGSANHDAADLLALVTKLGPQGRRVIATIARALLEESCLAKPGQRKGD